MKFKGVIFDFNGTLFYDTPFHNTAWQRMVKELTNTDLDDDLRVKMHGKNNRDILHCINKNISDEDIISYSKRKEAIYRDICLENPDKLHLVNGAIELFNYLKEHNIPFTIASASIKEDRWFDLNKIIYDDGSHNNKISMFNKAAKLIDVDINDCIIFEDSKSGIAFAKEVSAGMVVGIGNSFNDLISYGADCCIKDFTEFECEKYL